MYPATAAALTAAFVWSDMPDAMVESAHADSNSNQSYKYINIVSIRA